MDCATDGTGTEAQRHLHPPGQSLSALLTKYIPPYTWAAGFSGNYLYIVTRQKSLDPAIAAVGFDVRWVFARFGRAIGGELKGSSRASGPQPAPFRVPVRAFSQSPFRFGQIDDRLSTWDGVKFVWFQSRSWSILFNYHYELS